MQAVHDAVARHGQFPADARQFRAGGVEHVSVVVQAAPDLINDGAERLHPERLVRQARILPLQAGEQVANRPAGLQRAAYLEDLLRQEQRLDRSATQQRAHIPRAADRHVGAHGQEGLGLARLLLPVSDGVSVLRGTQLLRQRAAGRKGGMLCQTRRDGVVVQRAQIAIVHLQAEPRTGRRATLRPPEMLTNKQYRSQ